MQPATPTNAFDSVHVIYNPNSTGPSKENSETFIRELDAGGLSVKAELIPTEHAGHAEEIAYQLAKADGTPLIVSASGDGGYNEVVNGVLQAKAEGGVAICAVLASGNANDHSRTLLSAPLSELVLRGDTTDIDVLKISTSENPRYAHSYIGVGLTPAVAVRLNQERLNHLRETFIVYKALRELQPVELRIDGKIRRIDSLVIANIGEMAKVLTIADNAKPNDGHLKITVFPYRKRTRLIALLLKAIFGGIHGKDATEYKFVPIKNIFIQYDGEVHELQAGEEVVVSVMQAALTTIV